MRQIQFLLAIACVVAVAIGGGSDKTGAKRMFATLELAGGIEAPIVVRPNFNAQTALTWYCVNDVDRTMQRITA